MPTVCCLPSSLNVYRLLCTVILECLPGNQVVACPAPLVGVPHDKHHKRTHHKTTRRQKDTFSTSSSLDKWLSHQCIAIRCAELQVELCLPSRQVDLCANKLSCVPIDLELDKTRRIEKTKEAKQMTRPQWYSKRPMLSDRPMVSPHSNPLMLCTYNPLMLCTY